MKFKVKTILFVVLVFFYGNINAGEWKIGAQILYASGFSDLVDQYESNLQAQGALSSDVSSIPVGTGFKARFDTQSGVQFGIDLGPYFYISGGAFHFELPITATVGYSFFQHATISPFFRLGASYHIANGDFVDSRIPGLFAGAGIGIGKNWGVEAAVDGSTIKVEEIRTGQSIHIETYDVTVSVFALF